jgi:hypothetical protein
LFQGGSIQFFKKWKIHDLDAYFWTIIIYLHKTSSKEFEFLHKSYTTAIAMTTMTFPNGGYFGFKVI